MFDDEPVTPASSGYLKHPADNVIADRFWCEMQGWSDLSLQKPLTFLVNVYLVSSFLYYHLNDSILTDTAFDQLCRTLFKRYGEIQSHTHLWHRRLISQEALASGTGFSLKVTDYPALLVDVAWELYRRKGHPADDCPPTRLKLKLGVPAPVPPKVQALEGQMSLFDSITSHSPVRNGP